MRATEIIKLRLSLGMSQAEFADLLNVHQTTVSKWELGGKVSGLAYMALIRLKKEKEA